MSSISDAKLRKMIAKAKDASKNAYCPYSKFSVGAVVLTGTGDLYAGCNVENVSYGLTVCAERNAIFRAVAAGNVDVRAIVIYTPTSSPTAPCGACRQVANEFGPTAKVICVCDGPDQIETTIGNLLPGAFGPHNLGH